MNERLRQTVHFLLPGAAPESDRQMFQEVHHQSRLLARQLGHQVCVPLHGQVSFLLISEYCVMFWCTGTWTPSTWCRRPTPGSCSKCDDDLNLTLPTMLTSSQSPAGAGHEKLSVVVTLLLYLSCSIQPR